MIVPRLVRDEDRLTVVSRSPWLAGCGFALFGGFGLVRVVAAVREEEPGLAVVEAATGTILVTLGFLVLTLAHVTMVDKARGTYRSGWMTLGWWLAREGRIAGLAGVTVQNRGGRASVHLVGLTDRGVVYVFVARCDMASAARELAAEFAAFVGVRLFDESEVPHGSSTIDTDNGNEGRG